MGTSGEGSGLTVMVIGIKFILLLCTEFNFVSLNILNLFIVKVEGKIPVTSVTKELKAGKKLEEESESEEESDSSEEEEDDKENKPVKKTEGMW